MNFTLRNATRSLHRISILIFSFILFSGILNGQDEPGLKVITTPDPKYKLGPQLYPDYNNLQGNAGTPGPTGIATTCPNSNFSDGTFSTWKGCYGTFTGAGLFPCSTLGFAFAQRRHVIEVAPGYTDPYSCNNIHSTYPGEPFSARLGDTAGGGHAEQLKYTVHIDSNNYLFIYRYAVVLESPNHSVLQQPGFTIQVQDASGNLVDPCGDFSFTAPTCNNPPNCPSVAGWNYCPNVGYGGDGCYWKNWTTIGMNLGPYVGLDSVIIVFTTHGCSFTAHRGYAYISAYCSSLTIQTSLCEGQDSAILTAPPGFKYLWNAITGDHSIDGDTVSSIKVPSQEGATYNCHLTAVNNCAVDVVNTLHYTQIHTGFSQNMNCSQRPTSFTDTTWVSQNNVFAWRWFFGDPASGGADSSHLQNPTHNFTAPGNYTVTLISYSTEGCADTASKVLVVDTLVAINNVIHRSVMCSNNLTNINLNTNLPNTLYTWTAVGSSGTITGFTNNVTPTPGPINEFIINSGAQTDSVTYTIFPHNGTCTGDPFSFTVVVYPHPNATISGTAQACLNDASPLITFTGSACSPPYTFTYNINGGGNQIITTTVGNSVTVPAPTNVAGTFNYNLISVKEGSANACTMLVSGTATVRVYPIPTAGIAGTISVCQNAASPLITFTGASGTPPYTFTYNINGGANQNVSTVVGNSVTVAAPTNAVGVFSYNLVSVHDASPTLCSQAQAGSAVVTVNPLPTATISGTAGVCKNAASPIITFTGAAGTAPYTFTYNINGGPNLFVTTVAGNSVTVAAPTNVVGVFTYNLVSIQDASTTTCSQAQAGSAVITVHDLPVPVIGGSASVCLNSTTTYSTLAGMSNYNWTVTGGTIVVGQGTNTINVNWTSNGAQTITVVFTDLNGCVPAAPTVYNVNVSNLPVPGLIGTFTLCVGSTLTYTSDIGYSAYAWVVSAGGTITAGGGPNDNSVTVHWTVAAPQTISVNYQAGPGCSAPLPHVENVTVNPLPTATVSGTTAVCQNAASPLITFTGASATAPYTFTYNINGGANQIVTTVAGNSVTVAAPTNIVGTFTYNLVSVQDASTTTCSQVQAGSATVTVNPLPTATIAGTIAVCRNAASPLITFTGASATAPYTFTYNINGGANLFVTTVAGNSVTVAAPTNVIGTFIYTLLSVQDGSGTTCSQSQAGTAVVTVNPLPTATISGTIAVCQNGASPLITFTGASSTSPYTFTYNINGGANQIVTTVAGNSVTVAAPTNVAGIFTYNLVSVQDGSATTCSQAQAGSAVVTVNPLPTASISGTVAVCRNAASPLITFTGASGTAPYTFTYNINGGPNLFVTTIAGNSVTVAAPTNAVGSYSYNLLSVQDGSSTTCSQAQAGSAVVTVNQLPTATVAGTIAVCRNSASPLITFTGASSTPPYTFTYNINGGPNQFVTTVAGSSVTVPAPTNVVGIFTYNLVSVLDGSATACSQAQAGSATVTVNPLPTATIAGTVAVCQNAASPLVTFTGASSTAPYTFTYNINGGPNQNVTTVAGNSVTVAAPTNVAGIFTYNLVSVQDGSATTCSQPQAGSAVITVNPLPTATISGTLAVCLNSPPPPITFTGASGTAPYTFTYNINGGPNQNITTVVGNSVTVTAPTNVLGIFTYNLVSVQDGSATACSQAQGGSAVITVNMLPNPGLAGTNSICVGFSATYTTDAGMNNYTWNVSAGGTITAGGTGTDNTVTVLWTTAGAKTVSVNYVMGTGCTAPAPTVLNITVHPLPTPTIAGTNVLCAGPTTYVYSTQAGMTAYQWTVSVGGTVTAGGTNVDNTVTVRWPVAGVQTVTVNYTNANGCTALASTSYTVTVNPLPVPTISGAASVCLNSTSVYFTEAGKVNYIWSVSPGGTITAGTGTNSITVLWNTVGPKTIQVNYNDANGCTAPAPTSFNVAVNSLPVPTLTGLNSICSGISTLYTTDAGMNNYSWTVSAGGGIIAGGGNTDNTVTVLWNTAGAQTVSVNYVMGTGCTAPSPTVYPVTVKPRPLVTNAANSTMCSGGKTSIIPSANLGGTTYSWTANGSSGNVTGFKPGAGFIIGDTLVNSGFNIEFVDYSVTPSLNGCDGAIAHYIVTVYPVADVYFNPNGQSFCSGGTTSIRILSHVAGTTFNWTATGSSGNVSGFGPGVGDSIAQTLNNSGPWFENVNYHVFSLANGCPGNDQHVIVNMNPTPAVSFDMACNAIITTTDAKPFTLRGGLPLGGTYSGLGVSGGSFFPGLAGAGNITINYNYSNTWGCNANQSQTISVVGAVPFPCNNALTDLRDNKQYPTVKIGTQCWMAMNLDYGTEIASTAMQRDNCVVEKYCYQDNPGNCTSQGGLYQWDEMMRFEDSPALQGICPPSWHVPTEAEWTTLFNFYTSNGFAGSPLKFSGYSGFNAFLDGTRFDNMNWNFTNFATFIWSSTSHGPTKAWAHAMNTFNPSVSSYPGNRSNAFSIRCIKD